MGIVFQSLCRGRAMLAPDVLWKDGKFAQTSRRDAWWLSPAVVFLGFCVFLVYANWAAFQNSHYTYGPYISPFYSPELFGSSPARPCLARSRAGIPIFCRFLRLCSFSGYPACFG